MSKYGYQYQSAPSKDLLCTKLGSDRFYFVLVRNTQFWKTLVNSRKMQQPLHPTRLKGDFEYLDHNIFFCFINACGLRFLQKMNSCFQNIARIVNAVQVTI